MAEQRNSTPRRSRRPRQPTRRQETGRSGDRPPGFRERLRRDPFLFALCLGFLAFTTWALAITWRLMNDPMLLVLTIASLLPAFYLFYLRDSPAA